MLKPRLYFSIPVLLALLLAACSSGPVIDLALSPHVGDMVVYQEHATITAKASGEPIKLTPIDGTTVVSLTVVAVEGAKANTECSIKLANGTLWKIPLSLDTQTGIATVKQDPSLLLTADQLGLFHEHYAVSIGARPGKPVKVGATWTGELLQMPWVVAPGDVVPVPVQYHFIRIEDRDGQRVAVISLAGEKKLSIPESGKQPGVATGILTVSGTMVIDLGTRLVETSEYTAVTKLHHSGSGKDTEGSQAVVIKRIK